ncbi:hypothetical protein [Pseudoroseomonas cervicalis]|uniref:hypothetical protein n=1 Tax=Teichococcus cervicalis TaxID=204525 RepID=UPI0022F1D684|nr:hypothetical protein [Pseudoroseomonas cervicalis]WBV42175.1 hypothetical protein PFY06_13155 [Pseudoroseomonas cervicalis]
MNRDPQPHMPRPAEAAAALGVFLGQAVLPALSLAVAWLALRAEPAPIAAILAVAAFSVGLSLKLLYRRGRPWPLPTLPLLALCAILGRLALGRPGPGEMVFLTALLALSLGAAALARSPALERFLRRGQP